MSNEPTAQPHPGWSNHDPTRDNKEDFRVADEKGEKTAVGDEYKSFRIETTLLHDDKLFNVNKHGLRLY